MIYNILKLKLIISIAILFGITFNCCGQNWYAKGYEAYTSNRYDESIDFLDKAIVNNQDLAKSYMIRGAVKGIKKDLFSALKDLNYSKKIDSTNYKVYYHIGQAYFFNGFNNLALDNLNIAISMDENNSGLYEFKSIVKSRIGDVEGAIITINKAIKIDSLNSTFYTNRGFLKILLKQYEDAILDFNLSLGIKPSHKAYANRGYGYSLLQNYSKAIEDYSKALEISKSDPEIYYKRGMSYKMLDNIKAACFDFEKSSLLGYKLAKKELNELCPKIGNK